jgi:curved DNA-binding protein
MDEKDYYKVMGVKRDAPHADIQRAHRKLARKYHPDISKEPDAEARFKQVGEAWKVLKDPQTRAEYDQYGSGGKPAQPQAGRARPDAGFDAHARGFHPGDAQEQNDFFESLFGQRARGGGGLNLVGEDRHASIEIDLEDAYAGATRRIKLRFPEADGQGRMTQKDHEIEFVIPRGVRAGQSIRLAGQGAAGVGAGGPGDLFLKVGFRAHAHYRIDQREVFLDLPISPWEAALGASVEVPTPAGMVELTIPAGTATGRKLRLKGRGIPAIAAGQAAGDFYFLPQIVLPPADTEAKKQAWRDLQTSCAGFDPRAKPGVKHE